MTQDESPHQGRGPLLELVDIHKSFGSTRALRGVGFQVYAGEVHALLGQNGSGKSTLMKVAYGELSPTSGQILVDGRERTFASPHAAGAAGIAAVAQEVPVVPALSTVENILLGLLPARNGWINWRGTRRRGVQESAEEDVDVLLGVEPPRSDLARDRLRGVPHGQHRRDGRAHQPVTRRGTAGSTR